VGPDGRGVAHEGDSAAIDFRGRTLADAGQVPALLTVELPRGPLDEFREKFPAHLDADRFNLEL
jgi:predicted amidohydrolase